MWKFKCLCVTASRQLVNPDSTGIGQSHDLGSLVKCFAGSIIGGLSNDLQVEVVSDQDNLCMPAADRETQERKGGMCFGPGLRIRSIIVSINEMRQHMPLHVVDFNQGNVKGKG